MNSIKVEIECFPPFLKSTSRECFKTLFVIFAAFGLSGCATSKKISSLAPSPPEVRFSSLYYDVQAAETAKYLTDPEEQKKKDLSARDILIAASGIKIDSAETENFEKSSDGKKSCRIKDRFDRKAVLAYEWGENRLALHANGFDLGGSEDATFKIQYRLRLQPEKTRVEKCRYKSSWQGLVGSGYNEFFLRENDTVYEEFREIREKMQNYVDGAF